MIYISGIEDGSGDGTAAGRKAGWLIRARATAAPPSRTSAFGPAASPQRAAPEWVPARPAIGADGRPLPPDGSSPAPRRQTGAIPATAKPAASVPAAAAPPAAAPVFDPSGRPIPPAGTAPARPRVAAATNGGVSAAPRSAEIAIVRTPGAALPPGASPSAPAGHTYTARPAPAPPGEFLFLVRCSCGGELQAPVTLAALRSAAAAGIPAAAVIAVATQDALDAMHEAAGGV